MGPLLVLKNDVSTLPSLPACPPARPLPSLQGLTRGSSQSGHSSRNLRPVSQISLRLWWSCCLSAPAYPFCQAGLIVIFALSFLGWLLARELHGCEPSSLLSFSPLRVVCTFVGSFLSASLPGELGHWPRSLGGAFASMDPGRRLGPCQPV